MELELTTRRQVTRAMLARYAKGSRQEKGDVLDQLVGVTGWHRDHARKALRRAAAGPAAPGKPREPVVRYRVRGDRRAGVLLGGAGRADR